MRLEVRGGQTDTDLLRNIGEDTVQLRGPPRASPVEGTEHDASSCWVYDPNHMLPYQTCAVVNQAHVGHGSGACPNHRAAVLLQHVSIGTPSVSHRKPVASQVWNIWDRKPAK